jgi:glutamine amidotransferase
MIAIVDTGGANHASIQNALSRLGAEAEVTLDLALLKSASHLILPGVGHAGHAMQRLKEANLVDYLKKQTKPMLGICLGMQILFAHSDEGDVTCLDLIPGSVKKLRPTEDFRVPHMGWTQLKNKKSSLLLNSIRDDAYFYFVHSYFVPATTECVAEAQAPMQIPAMLEFKNIYATQFHPERSGDDGSIILKNFIALKEASL